MIYFVQAAIIGRIKIGYCHHTRLAKRTAALQTASPVPLVLLATTDGNKAREAALHARFAACRAIGEWFDPAPALVRFITRLQGRRPLKPRPRLKRVDEAARWLLEQFRQRGIWKSSELFALAAQAGVSRAAIFEAKDRLNLPRARLMACPDGTHAWFWTAGRGTESGKPVEPAVAAQGLTTGSANQLGEPVDPERNGSIGSTPGGLN